MNEVEEKCGATLSLGDDYGDNSCTIRCCLSKDHKGLHVETFEQTNSVRATITWEGDSRFEICGRCKRSVPEEDCEWMFNLIDDEEGKGWDCEENYMVCSDCQREIEEEQ